MTFLGIDVGTGGSRTVAVNADGKIIASATVAHEDFVAPVPGWAEQNPLDWWRASAESIRMVLSEVNPADISAIGLSGQMHGAVLLDERDEVLRPALIWCDQRTEKQCAELTDRIGAENLIKLVSNPALTNFTLTKMLWVRENEPEIWNRVRSVLLPKDYVRFCLTGDKATDAADASGTLLLDVANRTWSQEMLDANDLNKALLPELFESTEITGKVSGRCAAETGLISGTPVVAGAGDNAAGAIGMGLVEAGSVGVTIGTSGVVFAVTDQPAIDLKGRIHTFCHAVPNRWHVTGVTQAAGLSLRWFRENFAAELTYDQLTAEAERIPARADGLFWTPYLLGERTPHIDPLARASLIGLTARHTRGHVVRAIMEGVAFSLREAIEIYKKLGIPVETIRLGGGGAKSGLWRQIQADVYGQTVETLEAEEGAAYGAALLAGVGSGAWGTVEEACSKTILVSETVEPNPDDQNKLNSRYEAFKKIYPAVRSI